MGTIDKRSAKAATGFDIVISPVDGGRIVCEADRYFMATQRSWRPPLDDALTIHCACPRRLGLRYEASKVVCFSVTHVSSIASALTHKKLEAKERSWSESKVNERWGRDGKRKGRLLLELWKTSQQETLLVGARPHTTPQQN